MRSTSPPTEKTRPFAKDCFRRSQAAKVAVDVDDLSPARVRVLQGRIFPATVLLLTARYQIVAVDVDVLTSLLVVTGRQGLPLKLVDELGDEQTAIDWLAKEKNIDPKTPGRDYQLHSRLSDLPFLHTAVISLLQAVGLRALAQHMETSGAVQTVDELNLDGLLALWHPSAGN